MAERFTGQRCQDCQGGLIYVKKEKYWECPYCGKIYERELRFNKVQIDGLAGINDLVRSTFSKLISLNFKDAEEDLAECEKIDHASVGTAIARIAVALIKSFYTKDRQNELNKVNALLPKFRNDFPDIEEAEEILYDFIDSADIYGLLAVVFSMTGQNRRKEIIFGMLDCDEVFNPNVSKLLLNILLKEGRISESDIILRNLTSENCRAGITTVLNSYPSNEKKAEHIDSLLSRLKADTDMSKTFDTYFTSNKDDGLVVIDIFLSAISHKVNCDTRVLMLSVLQYCNDPEIARKAFKAIGARRLEEQTANAVMNWCIKQCSDASVSELAFKSLFASNSVFEVVDDHFISLFSSSQGEDLKAAKTVQMLNSFKMSGKNLDRVFVYHLIENDGSYNFRKKLFCELIDKVASVPLSAVEDYIFNVEIDGEHKPEFIELCFGKLRTAALASGVFSRYLKTAIDTPETRETVMNIFIGKNYAPDSQAFSYYLLNGKELHSKAVLGGFARINCKAQPDTFDRYISGIRDVTAFDSSLADSMTSSAFTLSADSFRKYLLNISEPESKKVGRVRAALKLSGGIIRNADISFKAANMPMEGNIAQAYLFTSKDDPYVMREILVMLQGEKIKLDVPLEAAGKRVKIKKFIESNSSSIDTRVEMLAKELL